VDPDQVFGLVFVLACGTIIPLALVFGIPVARALARRVEDLESRFDFSERLLARVQEQERLNG
jgi:hypothetical protein